MGSTLKMLVFASMLAAITGYAQKGIGEPKGVAEEAIPVALIELNGTVEEVKEGPCTYTVGESTSGIHLLVMTENKEVANVHLGPTWAISIWVEGMEEGQNVSMIVFRTSNLPTNHYIAKELEWDGQKAQIRDGYLKPFWAGRYGKEVW